MLRYAAAVVAAVVAAGAVVSVMLPTLISSTAGTGTDGDLGSDMRAELALSRFESVLMLLCYGLFLVFQLVTHR
jgi:Ca2+/H+ antiporter